MIPACLDNFTVVLHKPRYPGNIGSAARCLKNMGMGKLVVSAAGPFEAEAMKIMSTHFAADIVDRIRYYDRLDDALASFRYIVGTTSRLGSARGPVLSPREIAPSLADLSRHNEIALLFGSEDKGLSNSDLRHCHAVVAIPVSERLKSINLSHAVMILCYEIFLAGTERRQAFTPQLASAREIEGMYDQLKEVLMEIGFLNPQNPDYWLMHIRRLLARTGLFSRDVKIIRGICRQISWAVRNKTP
ncbi:MAG TPA: RNA methyltransferase [Syntrophales bacterium]|jgi:tRNA/rRNA methyltransferase|nr:RNA methyltransferase [Syntrophales bacterium]HQI36588.1 RNA methyltransferase [Syntrophales bacterium]HQJ31285.1 RNA methyltransferase [Syntrophales bacterium]HRR47677.1 RNA methyltransferase [Syntrophales bacterium]